MIDVLLTNVGEFIQPFGLWDYLICESDGGNLPFCR